MSAPASEDLRELERQLEMAAERGETMTINALRTEFDGSGSPATVDEVLEMLGTLRQHGKAIEEAPGEWRGPTLDELERMEEPARVTVTLPETPDGPPDPDEVRNGAGRALVRQLEQSFGGGVEPTVRITQAIAEQMTAEALGQLVAAGLKSVAEGETFLLEVLP